MTDDRSETLIRLMLADQAEDRDILAGTTAYAALRTRDAERRREVVRLLTDGWPEDADGLYAAAWLMNHGDRSEEAALGHRLATRAAELGHPKARWLAAAALDRSLMYAGLPQKYGTNIVPDGVGYRLWDVDPATTDADRAAHDVPSLAQMQARATAIKAAQPNLADAPEWLKRSIRQRSEG